jgi:hypothetical protein
MRPVVLRGASVTAVVVVLAAAILWLSRRPPGDVIPVEFRGTWLDQGADCQDISAQARITGSTINYDRLSFKADGVAERRGDAVSLTGDAYPDGGGERETVQLRLQDGRAKLLIVARDLRRPIAVVRCPAADK